MPITLERIPHDKQVAIYSLHSLGYSTRKIAKAVDISQPTVCYATRQIPSDLAEVERYKKGLIGWNYGISQRSMHRITDEKLDHMNALQLMTISAIGIDKARDMEGSNRQVFNIVTVVNEARQTMAKLDGQLSSIAARRTQLSSVTVDSSAHRAHDSVTVETNEI